MILSLLVILCGVVVLAVVADMHRVGVQSAIDDMDSVTLLADMCCCGI